MRSSNIGLETIAPSNTASSIQITTSSGGQVDLSHLKGIAGGTGYVNITTTDGTLLVGSLNCTAKTMVSFTARCTGTHFDGNILPRSCHTLSVGTAVDRRVGGHRVPTDAETAMVGLGAILQFDGHGV